MTDLCTIGPVSIENAHLFDNNTFSFSNSASRIVSSGSTIVTKGQFDEKFSFELICSYDEALQLKGLVEQGELVYMNTSDLTDNDYMQHKGWVILTGLTVDLENPTTLCNVKLEYIKISDHEKEYLTMDYSRGIYDGINLEPGYTISQTVYQLQDPATSNPPSGYSTIKRYPASGTNTVTGDGNEYDMASASAVDGRWQNTWITYDSAKFTPPFTFETVLDRNTLPGAASYGAAIGIMFSPNLLMTGDVEFQNKSLGDYLELQWNLANASTSMHYVTVVKGSPYGAAKWMKSGINMGTTYDECGLRVTFSANGNIKVETDLDTTGTWTQQYYGPSNLVNFNKGLYLYLFVKNRDSTSYTGSFQYINIWNSDSVTFPNVVQMPYNCTPITTETGHRTGEDGNIPYYTNPTTELRYTVPAANYYSGSVKLLSTNNSASSSRQVFGTDIKLTPTTTVLKNAFTKLTFSATGYTVEGWDSASWHTVNTMVTGTINLIRPLFINSERVVLQVNDQKITMLRSSPIITVEHPTSAITYTRRDRYNLASGLISSPAANADIAMTANTDYYCPIYDNASSTYQLLIGKRDPSTIKSDSLPAATLTAIGWFKSGNTGIDAADSLIQQWYKQTRTGISLKQIV